MLNVSMHSPKVKTKDRLTLEQFQNILSATKFSKEYTANLYNSFKSREMKYDTVSTSNSNSSSNGEERKKSKGKVSSKKLEIKKEIPQQHNSYLLNVKNIEEQSLHRIEIKDLSSQTVISGGNELDRNLQHSDVFICTFDVADEVSFQNSQKLIKYILNFKSKEYEDERQRKLEMRKSSSHKIVTTPVSDDMLSVFAEFIKSRVFLVGNGIDRFGKRKVNYSKALQIALDFGISYFETSSEENINIDELFTEALYNLDKNLKFISNNVEELNQQIEQEVYF
jgi:hypothetical protein